MITFLAWVGGFTLTLWAAGVAYGIGSSIGHYLKRREARRWAKKNGINL